MSEDCDLHPLTHARFRRQGDFQEVSHFLDEGKQEQIGGQEEGEKKERRGGRERRRKEG